MFHHISVGVTDVERAARFYDPVMAVLGFKRVVEYLPYAIGYGDSEPFLWVGLPHDQRPASPGNGTHIGFSARTRNTVDKFHAAALANGGMDNGPPGPREMYGPQYYGAFVIDVDGNKLEATLVRAARKKPAAKSKSATASRKVSSKKAKTKKKPTAKRSKRKARRR